jgi:hypothetical protein
MFIYKSGYKFANLSSVSGPPSGYNFNVNSNDAPINDDPRLEGVNVDDRVDGFVDLCLAHAALYRTVCSDSSPPFLNQYH